MTIRNETELYRGVTFVQSDTPSLSGTNQTVNYYDTWFSTNDLKFRVYFNGT